MKRLLDTEIAEETDLGTSHEWRLRRATLTDGRRVFVKSARRRLDGLFAAEAAGLRWLGESGDAPVPEVLAVDDTTLVLPWIESAAPTPATAERFGRELAALHASGAPAYGAPWEGYIASLPLDDPAALESDAGELAAVRARLERDGIDVLAYRFEGDRHCRAERFAAYASALGPRFVARVLPDDAARTDPPPFFAEVVGCAHSVFTAHLVDIDGSPTRRAVAEVIAFLRERLWAPAPFAAETVI